MVDGFPIPILFHFGLRPSVIPAEMVQRQRFYPGNWPVMYGRFSGGLVIVDTAAPDVDSFMAEVSIDLLRAAAIVAIPWRDSNGRGTVSAGFRRSYYELLIPLFVQGLSIQYTDYQLRAQYRWNSGFEASIFVLGSDDTLDQSMSTASLAGKAALIRSNSFGEGPGWAAIPIAFPNTSPTTQSQTNSDLDLRTDPSMMHFMRMPYFMP